LKTQKIGGLKIVDTKLENIPNATVDISSKGDESKPVIFKEWLLFQNI